MIGSKSDHKWRKYNKLKRHVANSDFASAWEANSDSYERMINSLNTGFKVLPSEDFWKSIRRTSKTENYGPFYRFHAFPIFPFKQKK